MTRPTESQFVDYKLPGIIVLTTTMTIICNVGFLSLCSLLILSTAFRDDELRMDPDYNPFWMLMGAPFTVACIKEGPDKVPIIWSIGGIDLTPSAEGFKTSMRYLQLSNDKIRSVSEVTKNEIWIEDYQHGPIRCFTNTSNGESEEKFLTANFFNVRLEHPNVTEEEDITLRCQPDQTASFVVWSRHGRTITNSTANRTLLLEQNMTLVIRDSRPDDAGLYECKVMMDGGLKKGSDEKVFQPFVFNVAVSGKPYLSDKSQPSSLEILLNGTVTLHCPVIGYPTPELYWIRHDDAPVGKTSRITYGKLHGVPDASLRITNLSENDLGLYRCVAENGIGRLVKDFRVGLVGGATSVRTVCSNLVLVLCLAAKVISLW